MSNLKWKKKGKVFSHSLFNTELALFLTSFNQIMGTFVWNAISFDAISWFRIGWFQTCFLKNPNKIRFFENSNFSDFYESSLKSTITLVYGISNCGVGQFFWKTCTARVLVISRRNSIESFRSLLDHFFLWFRKIIRSISDLHFWPQNIDFCPPWNLLCTWLKKMPLPSRPFLL